MTVLNEINKAQSPSAVVTIIDSNSGLFDKSVTDLDDNSKISLAGKILDAREKGTILTKMSEVKSYIPSEDGKTPGGSTTPSKGSSGSGSGSGTSGSKMTVVPGGNITDEKDELMSFADINEAKWAREAIESLVAKNVIKGYEDGDFKPNANITREEFVKIVVGAFGVEVLESESVFDDVSNDSWAKDYISAAKKMQKL
ncbi:MAG: S-layer homology domain-containing protein [Clostridiales bacterium]|nr:MAG: S-layer homology domain-containing protein [Clostridiales bacterium]